MTDDFPAGPDRVVQYVAHPLPWRTRLRVLLGRRTHLPLTAETVYQLVNDSVPAKLLPGEQWSLPRDGPLTATVYGSGGSGKLVAHGGPGHPGHMLPDGTWVGGGGAGATVTFTPGGTTASGGPAARPPWDNDWPGERECCTSTIGGRHAINCPDVQGWRARACCATVPGQDHKPACPASTSMQEAMGLLEAHNAPPAPITHGHAYDQPCTMACPAYRADATVIVSEVTELMPNRVRRCCGTLPGTGHLVGCTVRGD